MKILSGRLKDTQIPFRPQPGLRPTPDRVRKAVMDAMRNGWEGAAVLDLFSGTGALGLEALSAGAKSVVFVEADRRRAESIRALIREWGLENAARVERNDAAAALELLAKRGEVFDRVLADPPYEKGLALKVLTFFADGAALKPGAWIALETYKTEVLPDRQGRLERRRAAQYGDTTIHYYVLV